MPSESVLLQLTTKRKVINSLRITNVLAYSYHNKFLGNRNNMIQNPPLTQEIICRFFLDIVKESSPDVVLTEFASLFIKPKGFFITESEKALKEIISEDREQDFKNTLKRCIYILLNNWIFRRKYKPAQDLIGLLSNSVNIPTPPSIILKKLKTWLGNFLGSEDYQELKLYVSKYENREHWKSRYTSYLLAPQYANSKNLLEQREAAKRLSKQLQDQFKLDLAMYAAFSQCRAYNKRRSENPTSLGDEAMRLIKKIVAKRGLFSYANLANIFLKQTQSIPYKEFKQSLIKYLLFSLDNPGLVESLQPQLEKKLEILYANCNERGVDDSLLLKTCNRTIEYLTTEKNAEPSALFISLASQGNPLALAILLLKIILISPSSRTYLEVCMAKLIKHYEDYSSEECQWVINFLEVSKIILTIFTENVQYNLVNMENVNLVNHSVVDEDAYRVFSQIK